MAVVTPLTLATARARAQAMMDEPGVVHITTTQWLTLANSALMDVFQRVADVNPDQFATQYIIAYTANANSVLISDANTTGDIYRLLAVNRYTSATPNYGSEVPVRLTPIRLGDLTLYRASGRDLAYVQTTDSRGPTHYAVSGGTKAVYLYLAPVPTSAVYLQLTYVKTPATMTADGDEVALPVEYHDAFVTRLASRVNMRTGGRNAAVEAAWREAEANIERTAGPKIDDEPWNVRVVPEYY